MVVESHALALNDLQRKVDEPSDPQLISRKLCIAERQTRQAEQATRLEGIIFSPEVTPSHAPVDLCVNMLEQNVLTCIKPEECTSRSQEIQSLKKDAKVSLDASRSIKITSKAASTTCSVGSELDIRNAFQWRSLAMDQAKLWSSREIEMWVQHLFLSHERSQPSGFASVTLQQIIECDKQMFIRASNNLVGKLQAEPGVVVTPLDKEIKMLRTSPELMPYLMPMPTKHPSPKAAGTPRPNKRATSDAFDQPAKIRKGKGKGEGKSKSKSKQWSGIDIPPGCVSPRRQTESRFALHLTKGCAASKDLALNARGDITSVTSRAATRPSHTMSAATSKNDNQPQGQNNIQFHLRSLLQ